MLEEPDGLLIFEVEIAELASEEMLVRLALLDVYKTEFAAVEVLDALVLPMIEAVVLTAADPLVTGSVIVLSVLLKLVEST